MDTKERITGTECNVAMCLKKNSVLSILFHGCLIKRSPAAACSRSKGSTSRISWVTGDYRRHTQGGMPNNVTMSTGDNGVHELDN